MAKRQCSVDGCERSEYYRERRMCRMHYQRFMRWGTTEEKDRRLDRRPVNERFWEKVVRSTHDGCWEWQAGTVRGYGYLQRGGRHGGRTLAHRLSWEMHRGPVPDGQCVLHRCDNPPCVNPDHLFLGTHGDNHADMVRKGRAYSAFRARPEIIRGQANNHAKLTEAHVREIRRLVDSGWPYVDVAARFGVTRQNVRFIANGTTWRHVA